jgi:hypothetical protein
LKAFDLFAAAAITIVLTQAKLFAWFRGGAPGWQAFAKCPLCVGTWVGMGTYWLFAESLFAPWASFWTLMGDLVHLTGFGALTGCLALAYERFWEWLEAEVERTKQ